MLLWVLLLSEWYTLKGLKCYFWFLVTWQHYSMVHTYNTSSYSCCVPIFYIETYQEKGWEDEHPNNSHATPLTLILWSELRMSINLGWAWTDSTSVSQALQQRTFMLQSCWGTGWSYVPRGSVMGGIDHFGCGVCDDSLTVRVTLRTFRRTWKQGQTCLLMSSAKDFLSAHCYVFSPRRNEKQDS